MFVVEYDLWGNSRSKGVWNFPFDTIVEAKIATQEYAARTIGVLKVMLLDAGDGRYVVYANDIQKGRVKIRQL